MADLPDYMIEGGEALLLQIFVQPKAAKDELVGVHGDALKLKVRAVPEDGRANASAVRLLADLLGLPAARLKIVAGRTSRYKKVAIEGGQAIPVAARLERLLSGRGGR